ncbi:MAG: hypothetical protein PHQ32_03745 [Firmicutes bacterium]|nr:hypothetical protein [Bacillota bacterium]
MNKILKLIRINMKDTAGRYLQQLNAKGKVTGKLIALLPLLAALPAIAIIALIYNSFAQINLGYLALTYTNIAAIILMLVSSVPLIVSSFFYSKDLSLLATLPIKGRSIVISKLAGIYPYLMVIGLVLFGTTSILYLNDTGFQIRSFLILLIATITLPLIPMALGTLITLPFMSLIAGKKNRGFFTILGNLVLLGVILGIEVLLSRTASNPEAIVKILSQKDGLLNLIGKGYPPSIWLTKGIVSSNLDILWYSLIQIGAIVLVFLLASKIYDQALKKFNQQESSGDSQKITYKKTGIKLLLLKRNLGIIFTNPTFLLNTIMTMFIPVILFVLYSLMGIMDINTLNNPALLPFRDYILLGIILSPSIIGSLSATSISREGKYFWETRVMPIRHEESIASREMTTLLLNGIGQAILAVTAYIILPVAPLHFIVVILTVIFATILMSKIDLMINIERPYLNWSNPTACIKNNMNVMISLASRVVFGGIAYLIFYLMGDMDAIFVISVVGLFSLILYLITLFLFKKTYLDKYSKIDAI